MAVACDVRVCAEDARFCVKEVDLAITADIGTLQRLPTLVGHGVAAEMALTARVVGAEEGTARGLVVGAVMREREMPWQRWHLIDSSLSELERVARSELTVGFKARYASWVPALHKDKVRAEHAAGVEFIDYDGLFGIVGLETPSSVLDSR